MAKVLGIASTPYHLLVFLFLKDAYLSDDTVDLIITDKTPSLEEVYRSGRLDAFFNRVSFADGRKIKNPYKHALTTLFESFVYNPTTKAIIDAPLDIYDRVFFASPGAPDEIVKEIAKTLIKKNRHVTFHRFEDGFASYTKASAHVINTESGIRLYRDFFHYDVEKMEKEMYLFEPDMAEAQVTFEKVRIDNNQARIDRVIAQAKEIFQFQPVIPKERVIFLGQGTLNGQGNASKYRSLIKLLASISGQNNFIIKPHPRGVNDQFTGELSMYEDKCPFELAIASGAMEDKTLISFYSTATVSGKLLFHSKSRIIFLYPLAEDSFNEKCDYEHYFSTFASKCDNVFVARSWDEVEALLKS